MRKEDCICALDQTCCCRLGAAAYPALKYTALAAAEILVVIEPGVSSLVAGQYSVLGACARACPTEADLRVGVEFN